MFFAFTIQGILKACKPFYEPQRNKRKQRGRNGRVFSSYPCECLSKPADYFTNHKGTREDKVAGSVIFFAFNIQSVFQSPPIILRTTKGQKETKRPEWTCFHLYHPRYPSRPTGHFANHKGTTEDRAARMGVFSSLPFKVSFKACRSFY